MQDPRSAMTGGAAAEAADVAAVAGHALNNVLAHLFAAAGHLEEPGADAVRARGAVDEACRGGQALAASLTLLGMTAANLADVPPLGQRLDATALARVLATAAEVSGLQVQEARPMRGAWMATLDPDTIATVLICAAVTLRRAWGQSRSLRCTLVGPGPDQTADARLVLRLEAADDGGPAPVRRAGHGPCELALAHVAPLLPGLDAGLEDRGPAGIDLVLHLRNDPEDRADEGAR